MMPKIEIRIGSATAMAIGPASPGVAPTGPLPEAIDFPLIRMRESDRFRVLLFGDTQPYTLGEVDLLPGDGLAYALEATDNNARVGGQVTRSQTWRLRLPTISELFDQSNTNGVRQ